MKRRVLLLLLCTVLTVLPAAMNTGCSSGYTVTSAYDDAERYTAGNFTYRADEVDHVSVNWYLGVVEVRESDTAVLKVSETAEGLSEAEQLHWYQDEDELYIEFCESGYYGRFENADKHLILEVPKNVSLTVTNSSGVVMLGEHTLKELDLKTASGNFSAGNLTAEKISIRSSGTVRLSDVQCTDAFSLKNQSGRVTVNSLSAEEMEAESFSGDIEIGSVQTSHKTSISTESGYVTLGEVRTSELEVETHSANVKAALFVCTSVQVETLSGNVTLALKDNFGAVVDFHSTSGKLNAKQNAKLNRHDGEEEYVFASGQCRINVTTTSGNLTVE